MFAQSNCCFFLLNELFFKVYRVQCLICYHICFCHSIPIGRVCGVKVEIIVNNAIAVNSLTHIKSICFSNLYDCFITGNPVSLVSLIPFKWRFAGGPIVAHYYMMTGTAHL